MSGTFHDEHGRSIAVTVISGIICVLAVATAIVMYKIEQRIIEREGLRPYLEEISASMPGFGDEVYTHNQHVKDARKLFEKYQNTRIASCFVAFFTFQFALHGWLTH